MNWIDPYRSTAPHLISYRLNLLICKRCGHSWESQGYAGPDSGYEAIVCLQCGESHYIAYY